MDISIQAFVAAMGLPSAITGLLVWWLKRYIDKRDAKNEEREKNIETLMELIMKTSRANNVLATATAKAVQRIPDAQCNGDMTSALEEASRIQAEEKNFLISKGVEHLFGN